MGLARMALQINEVQILTLVGLTEGTKIKNGIIQEDILTPTLFNIAPIKVIIF